MTSHSQARNSFSTTHITLCLTSHFNSCRRSKGNSNKLVNGSVATDFQASNLPALWRSKQVQSLPFTRLELGFDSVPRQA